MIDPDAVIITVKNSGVTKAMQFFANTANWVQSLPQRDLAFIDGCQGRKFVHDDTLKLIPFVSTARCKSHIALHIPLDM